MRLNLLDFLLGEDLKIHVVGNVGKRRPTQGGKQGKEDRHLHQHREAARQGIAKLFIDLAHLLLEFGRVILIAVLDFLHPLLHQRLRHPHPAHVANRPSIEGIEGKANDQGEGHNR